MTRPYGSRFLALLAPGLALGLALGAAPALAQQKLPADVNRLLIPSTFNNGLGYGARALGMGGAFSAIADDASAASWNPAGLGQLFRPEVTVAGSYAKTNVEFNGESSYCVGCFYLTTPDFDFDAKKGGLDFISVVYPFKVGKQVVTTQASYTRNARPTDADYSYRLNYFTKPGGTDLGPDFYDTQFRSTGGYDSVGLSFASGLADKLYIGLSLNYWFGSTSSSITEKFLSLNASGQTLVDAVTHRDGELNISGLSANVGLLYKPSGKVSLGLVYRGGFSGTNDESSAFRSSGSIRNASGQLVPFSNASSATFDSTLNWPATIGGGIAFRPADVLTLALDGSYTFWNDAFLSRVVRTCNDASGCSSNFTRFPSLAGELPEQNGQSAIRFGAEYVARLGSVAVPFRAGAYRIRTIAPFYANGDTDPGAYFNGFSFGAGVAIPAGTVNVIFDIAATWDRANSDAGNYTGFLTDSDGNPVPTTVTQTGERRVTNSRLVSSLIVRF